MKVAVCGLPPSTDGALYGSITNVLLRSSGPVPVLHCLVCDLLGATRGEPSLSPIRCLSYTFINHSQKKMASPEGPA